LDSAHKSGDAWVRIASSVQTWIVVQWENPQRLEPIRILAHLIPINAPPAETARWKRCVPRLPLINVWISKGFYLHMLQIGRLFGKCRESPEYLSPYAFQRILAGKTDLFITKFDQAASKLRNQF